MTIRSRRAPIFMQEMLCDAVAYINHQRGWWEWFATDTVARYPWAGYGTKHWVELDTKGRARWFTSQLCNCGDFVAADHLAVLGLTPGMTYARVVALWRRDLEPELSAHGERIISPRSRTLMSVYGRARE